MTSLEHQKLLQQQQLQNQQPWNQSLCFDQHVIDHFIISQNERLRLLKQEQSKQQLWLTLKEIESRASNLVKRKDEAIQKARNKAMELQNSLKKLGMDKHAWERVARRNQETVTRLNKKLETLKQQAFGRFDNDEVDDAESCCEVINETNGGLVCKGCKCRRGCVLFLPCRHLCSCKDCEPLFDSCPVCTTPKKGSIEALFS